MKTGVIMTMWSSASAIAMVAAGMAFTMPVLADSSGTYVTNGVEWTWKSVDSGPYYCLGGGNSDSLAMSSDIALDASLIPWGYIDDNDDYRVVNRISDRAFYNCSSLTGVLTIPSTIQHIGDLAFRGTGITRAIVEAGKAGSTIIERAFYTCPNLKGVWYKGCGKVNMYQHFYNSTALKLVVFGAQIEKTGTWTSSFHKISGCKIFYSANQPSWNVDSSNYGAENEAISYGEGQDFDMAFSDTEDVVTIYPTTETAVTNAIAWAPLFKDALGLDMKIAITNRIEISDGVEISESMLQNVTLEAPAWYLTFAVTSQTQLDNVLSAVSVDTPIIIDIDGVGRNQIQVPDGRNVAILAKSGWTFGKKTNGLSVTFR